MTSVTPVTPAPVFDATVKCLLVDDLEENLLAISALLRDAGVELLQARSGRDALELLLVHDIALAFVDVQMPDMDGFELAELMRGSQRTRHVPIIFVTAGAHDQRRVFKGYDTGAVDFLWKPIEPHILKSKAGVFFELHRQRQQLARELRERTETLRLNEMFAAVLGHDLRSPLSTIILSADKLQRRPEEAVQKVGARLLQTGKWMSRMIEDMLDLSRARLGGGIRVARVGSDLGVLIQRVVDALLEGQPDTPPAQRIELQLRGDLTVACDPDRMMQAATNLIGNALQHGVPSEPVRVEVDGTQADVVRLSVSNAGVISDQVLPMLFDPFRGRQRQSGRGDGLGLGLYIVQQIVIGHDGEVEVESTIDAGTCFRVTIPRRGST